MHQSLKTQLENLDGRLPVVPTVHYVLFQRTEAGPVAFLLEKVKPKEDEAAMFMQLTVEPAFDKKVFSDKKGDLRTLVRRKRYEFRFREPRKPVKLKVPANGQAACTNWMKVADRLYDRLRAHDSTAWEDLLCMLLDVPRSSKRGKSSAGSGGKG